MGHSSGQKILAKQRHKKLTLQGVNNDLFVVKTPLLRVQFRTGHREAEIN